MWSWYYLWQYGPELIWNNFAFHHLQSSLNISLFVCQAASGFLDSSVHTQGIQETDSSYSKTLKRKKKANEALVDSKVPDTQHQ